MTPSFSPTRSIPSSSTSGGDKGWAVQLNRAPAWFHFGMIVWTVGFGQERCEVDVNYRGFAFWETEPFQRPDCGLAPEIPRIVISGSGDGALQDFLRITTNRKSAEEILRACPLPISVAETLQSAEDLAQRAYQWGTTKTHDHRVLQTLHDHHRRIVEGLVGPARTNNDVVDALNRLIRNPLPEIHLISSCRHFANAYGLNRFLAILVSRFLQLHRNRPDVLKVGKHVREVRGLEAIRATATRSPATGKIMKSTS